MTTPVTEIMSPGVIWCFEEDDVESLIQLMEDEQIRRVPVMNAKRKLPSIC
ncbi:MAG: CBS domain-containing protein [Myxococcaceae bacterium]